jgi:hypothetical protein
MKFVPFIFLLLFFISCSVTSKVNNTGEKFKIPKDLNQFLSDFEYAVITNNQSQVLNFMDPDYIKEQLDDFLQGRTEQFLNEFFCGMKTDGSGFECPEFDNITNFEFVNIEKTDENMYRVVYLIITDDTRIECDWGLMIIPSGVVYRYGLVGASG